MFCAPLYIRHIPRINGAKTKFKILKASEAVNFIYKTIFSSPQNSSFTCLLSVHIHISKIKQLVKHAHHYFK